MTMGTVAQILSVSLINWGTLKYSHLLLSKYYNKVSVWTLVPLTMELGTFKP